MSNALTFAATSRKAEERPSYFSWSCTEVPGRPRKPLVLHKIEGTGRKDRDAKRAGELQLDPQKPSPPEWLRDEGLAEWNRLMESERYAAALSVVDRGMVAMYCQLWARYVEGEKADDPIGGRQLQTLVAVAAKLGLNPTDRTKVKVPQSEQKADDPWAKLG